MLFCHDSSHLWLETKKCTTHKVVEKVFILPVVHFLILFFFSVCLTFEGREWLNLYIPKFIILSLLQNT